MLIILIISGIMFILYGIKLKAKETNNDFNNIFRNAVDINKDLNEVKVEEQNDLVLDKIDIIEDKIESLSYVLDILSEKIDNINLSINKDNISINNVLHTGNVETKENEEIEIDKAQVENTQVIENVDNTLNIKDNNIRKLPDHSNDLLEKIKLLEEENKNIEEISKELNIGKGEILLLKNIWTK